MYLQFLCCLLWAVRVVLSEHEPPAAATPITPTGKPVEEVKKKYPLFRSTQFITLGAGEGSEKSEFQRTLENLYLWQRMRLKVTENEVYPPRTREKRSMLAMDKPPTSNIYHLAQPHQDEDKDVQTEDPTIGWNLSDYKVLEKMLDDINNWEPTVQAPPALAAESIEGYEAQEFSEADLKDTTDKSADDHVKQNEQSADQTSSPVPEPLDHLPSTHEELSVEPNINPEDIFGGEKPPLSVGSIRGIPGLHFPDYEDIPISPFKCTDKEYFPGFYADMDTGCQVFHVCYQQRRESFLCPVGTIFNQAILTCDHWYSSNCSLTPLYYSSNAGIGTPTTKVENPPKSFEGQKEESKPLTFADVSSESKVSNTDDNHPNQPETFQSTTASSVSGEDHLTLGGLHLHSTRISPAEYLDLFTKFFPVKVKVTVYPVSSKTKVVAVASVGDIKRENDPGKRQHTTTTKRPRPSTTKRWHSTTTKRWHPTTTKKWHTTTTKKWHTTTTKKWHPTTTKRHYHTTSKPHTHTTKKPYPHHRSINPSVHENVNDAFEIVRRILEHVGQLLPSQESSYPSRSHTYPSRSHTYPRSCPCLDRHGNPTWCPCSNRNVHPRMCQCYDRHGHAVKCPCRIVQPTWCRCLDENRHLSRCPCRNENWYPRWENPTFREIDAILKAKDEANKAAEEQEGHVKEESKKPCNPVNKQVDESKTTGKEELPNSCDETISNTDEISTGFETLRDIPQHAVPPRPSYRPLTQLKPRFIVKPVNA